MGQHGQGRKGRKGAGEPAEPASRQPQADAPTPEQPPAGVLLSRLDVAALAGVGRVTVERAIHAGELRAAGPAKRGGPASMYTVAEVASWLRLREAKAAEKAGADEDSAKGRKLMAEAKLKELKLAEEEGRFVPADEVEARWTERVGALREALRAIPGMAVQAGLVAARDEVRLETMLRDALVSYARTVRAAIVGEGVVGEGAAK